MYGEIDGVEMGQMPRRSMKNHSADFVEVNDETNESTMKTKFNEFLYRWAQTDDATSKAPKSKDNSSRRGSMSKTSVSQFMRSNSIMDRMFKKPKIGHILDIEFDHQKYTDPEYIRNHRWSRGKSRENTQMFLRSNENKFGFVINPNNTARQAWDIIAVTICLIYTALRVPVVIAFDIDELEHYDAWFVMNRIVDLVFISDIFIIFLTAYQDGKHFVVSYRLIAKQYLKTWFFLDLVSSVPLDLIAWFANPDHGSTNTTRSAKLFRVIKITRTLRILRIFKLQRVMFALESFLNLNFSVMSIGKFCCGILLGAHLIACGFLWIGRGEDNGWMEANNDTGENQDDQYWYITSLYWAFTTMTTIGYGDIRAITENERMFATVCMIFGGVTFTYGVTRIVGIVSTMGKSKIHFRAQLESLKEWAEYHTLDADLISDVKTYLHYKNTQMYYNEDKMMMSLSKPLQKRILKQIYAKSLEKIELFQNIKNDGFLSEIMLRLKSEFAQPYQLIVKEGDVADSMYMIRKGVAAAFKGKNVKDIKSALLLSSGQGFDEIGLLADNVLRTASVVSLDWCDLGYLTKQDFASVVDYFPKQRELLEVYALTKIEEYKKACEGRLIRQPIPSLWACRGNLSQQPTGVPDLMLASMKTKGMLDSVTDISYSNSQSVDTEELAELNRVPTENAKQKSISVQIQKRPEEKESQKEHECEIMQSAQDVKLRMRRSHTMNQENVDSIMRTLNTISHQLGSLKRQVKRNEECIREHSSKKSQSAVSSQTLRENLASDEIVVSFEEEEQEAEARPSHSLFGPLRAVMAATSLSRTNSGVDPVTTTVPLNDE